MHHIQELKDYVGFTDADGQSLRALWPQVAPGAEALAGRFYDGAARLEGARAFLQDAARVAELRRTLIEWLRELLNGPWDDAYCERRRRIGDAHMLVHLPQAFMFTSMNLLRHDLLDIAGRALAGEPLERTRTALLRIMDIDLALMVGAYMEVHEQAHLADLRELIISRLPTPVVIFDREQRVLSMADPSGLLRPGETFTDVIPAAIIEAAALPARVVRATSTRREIILPRVDATIDGEERCFRVTIAPLDHPVAETMIHVEDLTEVVAAQARTEMAEHLAELGMMAASIAHELRNPLGGIRAALQVVRSSFADEDPRSDVLDKVQEQTVRLGSLAADLLSFARPLEPKPRRLRLRVVLDAIKNAEPGAVTVTGDGFALGDAALLTQVLLNLVQNATQAGASEVQVSADGPRVQVVDNGPGIEAALRQRVFEPFFTTKTRGTGLGLPIARKLVVSMGGTLDLCASPLGGAGFLLSLPEP